MNENYLTSSSSISGTLYFGGYVLVTSVTYALKGDCYLELCYVAKQSEKC